MVALVLATLPFVVGVPPASAGLGFGRTPTLRADASEALAASPANPTIVTHASPAVPVGGTISGTAILSGGNAPTGSIAFHIFGPDDATCSGIPAFSSTVNVVGNATYSSGPFTVSAAGAYRIVVTYNGDAGNSPAGPTACSDPNDVTSATLASPAVTTTASLSAPFHDTASLTGGLNPTGTITFTLYGPGPTTCTGLPAFVSTVSVNGDGNYISANFTETVSGIYTFVASYSGDSNNNAFGPTACNIPAETLPYVPPASDFSISTTASPSVSIGQSVFDAATLGTTFDPTGTITFDLYGPDNATCSGTPVFTGTDTVDGNGTYVSGSFTPEAAGGYEWVVTYSGDADIPTGAATPCDDPAGAVTVFPSPQIGVTKSASPPTRPAPGGGFTFTITVNNPGADDPVKVTSLSDNLFGNLANLPGSTCGALIGTTLAPGASSQPCSFTTIFSGNPGDSQTDTVTVSGVDPRGVFVVATAQATVTLGKAQPTIATTASKSVSLGGTISDTAVLSRAVNPTGKVTFMLFGPNEASCRATPIFTSAITVTTNGTATSGAFTPRATGTYRWVAAFGGDASNHNVAASCNGANEAVMVTRGRSTIAVTVSPPTPGVNQPITFTADVTSASSAVTTVPTGTVSFFVGGSSTAAATVALVKGQASFVTNFGVGGHAVTASYSGDGNFWPSNSLAATTTVDCGVTGVSEPHGSFCVVKAPVKRSVVVFPGGVLDIERSTVDGSVVAIGAATVRICGSTIDGSVGVIDTTGLVIVGDPADNCAPNTIDGSLVILSKPGRADAIGNAVRGRMFVSGD